MKPHLWFIRALSRLIPYRWRTDWRQEWEAELQHRESLGRPGLLRRSLGSFWDALAMQPRRLEEEMFQDLRFGMRMFTKNKALTITAILSLALGIGANTALFSMIDTVLLKKLPVRNPDELVLFQWSGHAVGMNEITTDRDLSSYDWSLGDTFSYSALEQFRAQNRTLAGVFGFAKPYQLSLIVDDKAETGNGQWVSGNFFSGLSVGASLGRTITDDDDKASAAPAAVISHRYWERRFALDAGVLGKTITVNGAPFIIVGVSAPDFTGTLQVDEAADVFLPLSFEPAMRGKDAYLTKPEAWWIYVMGRTKRGVSLDQVRGNLQGALNEAAFEGLQKLPPQPGGQSQPPRLDFFSGSRGLVDSRQTFEEPLLILMILVCLVLLIACANVANLLLARAATRQKEIAVRLAMGAGRLRLVRQLLTESVLLAACGGICGAPLAYLTKHLVLRWGPWANSATPLTLKLDFRALAFTTALSVATGILFGLAPAFASTRRNPSATMKDNSRTLASGRSYIGKSLLVLQVALSIMLLIGAGLFVRSLHNLRSVVSGFDPESLLQFDIDPKLAKIDPAKVAPVFEQMIERIESVPGVRSASIAAGDGNFLGFKDKSSGQDFRASYSQVRENFFDTMGIPLLVGRGFTASDNQTARQVVIVNEAFVHKYFPDASPLGQTANGEIVGVVRDSKLGRLRQDVAPAIYYSYRQSGYGRMTFRIRTRVDPASIIPAVRQAVQQVDSHLPISNVRTLAEQVDQTMAKEKMFAGLSTLFGVLALILTCVGFYGIIAYSVARRTNEIGVRMALGAKRFDVLRLVMGEGLFLVLIGSVLGVCATLASTGYIASILFDLAPNDGSTITLAVFLMAAIAALAAFIPARKASRIDPLVALRYE